MSKAPQLFSSSYPQGTNLSTNKKVYKATTYQVSNSNQKQDNKIEIEEKKATRSSFRVFKYLIVTTVIIFAFGSKCSSPSLIFTLI